MASYPEEMHQLRSKLARLDRKQLFAIYRQMAALYNAVPSTKPLVLGGDEDLAVTIQFMAIFLSADEIKQINNSKT